MQSTRQYPPLKCWYPASFASSTCSYAFNRIRLHSYALFVAKFDVSACYHTAAAGACSDALPAPVCLYDWLDHRGVTGRPRRNRPVLLPSARTQRTYEVSGYGYVSSR